MKLHFDNVNLSSSSGPNTFAKRLIKGLLNRGVELTDSGPEADVSLVFIEPSGKPLASKVIQRLDGIWFKPEEFKIKNIAISSLYARANAVIWQSNFDRSMTTRWWGSPKHGRVIHNGISSKEQPGAVELKQVTDSYETIFVASSNWHPQKRLRNNIEMFFHLKQNWYPNSCLIVMGANPDCWAPDPHVMYTGSLPHEQCLAIYDVAHWMIHLAWLDHCPNVVIEALSRKVPVICSSAGGTRELVEGYGLVLQEKQEYGLELTDYDNPPLLDVSQIKSQLPARDKLGTSINIDIDHVVDQYMELLNNV